MPIFFIFFPKRKNFYKKNQANTRTRETSPIQTIRHCTKQKDAHFMSTIYIHDSSMSKPYTNWQTTSAKTYYFTGLQRITTTWKT